MEKIINACVSVVTRLFRFDTTTNPKAARKKSLIILLVVVIGIQIALFWSLLN